VIPVTLTPAQLRVWILAVALGSFAAGMVMGFVIPDMMAADRPADGNQQQYARELVQRYELTPDQYRSVLLVLQSQAQQEFEILRSAEWAQLPPALQNRRLAAQRLTEQRIRAVLDERQRALYDRDSRPGRTGYAGSVDPDRENR